MLVNRHVDDNPSAGKVVFYSVGFSPDPGSGVFCYESNIMA